MMLSVLEPSATIDGLAAVTVTVVAGPAMKLTGVAGVLDTPPEVAVILSVSTFELAVIVIVATPALFVVAVALDNTPVPVLENVTT